MSWKGTTNQQSFSLVPYNIGRKIALDRFLNIDCKSGKIGIGEAHRFFNQMLYMRPPPPISCFITLLSGLVKCEHFSATLSFYKRLSVSGVLGSRSNLSILSILINCYSRMKLGSVGYSALGLILKNGHCPSIITFTSLVRGLCVEEKVAEAVGLLSKMFRSGCAPDIVTYTSIIDGLCKTGNVRTALELHREVVAFEDQGSRPSTTSYTLVDGDCIEWPWVDAEGKDARFIPNVFYYNCLIDGLRRSGMDEDAKSLLVEMIGRGVVPDKVTYTIVINTLCKKGKVEEARGVLEMMILRGKPPDIVTYSTLIDGYCKIGEIETAMSLFNDMNSRGIFSDTVTITTLLKGLFCVNKVEDAMILFRSMQKMRIHGACRPDEFTYGTMIDGLCKGGHTSKAHNLFREMLVCGVRPTKAVYNALVHGFHKEGDMDKAKELFLQMQSRGISPGFRTYNVLVDGLYRSGNVEEANTLLEKMVRDGISPNVVTFKILMRNLGKKGSMEQAARNVTLLMESCSYGCDAESYNTLIHGYCKAGLPEDAYNLLVEMEAKGSSPHVATYRALIRCLAHEKDSARVKELIQKMHNVRISSNSNTTPTQMECISMDDETR